MNTWARRDWALIAIISLAPLSCTNQPERDQSEVVADTTGVDLAAGPREVTETVKGDNQALDQTITVARSGGLAGYDDRVVIYPDGQVERIRGGEALVRVEQDVLRELTDALAEVGSGISTQPPEIGADLLTYRVEWGERQLEFGTLDDDDRLRELEEILRRLLTP